MPDAGTVRRNVTPTKSAQARVDQVRKAVNCTGDNADIKSPGGDQRGPSAKHHRRQRALVVQLLQRGIEAEPRSGGETAADAYASNAKRS
jgi:hypothetical protein